MSYLLNGRFDLNAAKSDIDVINQTCDNLEIRGVKIKAILDTLNNDYKTVMEEGFREAYEIIMDLRKRLEAANKVSESYKERGN